MSKTAEKFYDDQRKKGLTDKITINPEPDYSLPFYQEIFDLMDGFASELELTQVPVGDDTPLSRCLKRISELEKEIRESEEKNHQINQERRSAILRLSKLVDEKEKEIQELKRELARYEIHDLKRK